MAFETYIAFRYLFAKRKQSFIFIISLMSIIGVAIGVAALVIVFGVYNGFTTDIRDKILGANAHVMLMAYDNTNFDNIEPILDQVNSIKSITGATPFIYSELMLSSPQGVKGVILRGIDPKTAPDVISLLNTLEAGSLNGLHYFEPADINDPKITTPGVIIGSETAKRFGLTVGSRLNLLSPSGNKTSAGFVPKIQPFKVSGIFKAGLNDYDSNLIFTSLEAAQDLLGLPRGRISGVEAKLDDPYKAPEIATKIQEKLGASYYTRSWMDLNANLFAALKLEKIGMFLILSMVIVIGSFSVVTSLVMLVMEKTKDIAILMSMGATRKSIRKIFMLQGTIIGLIGTTLGYIIGLTLSFLLKKYEFIKLPAGVYSIDHLPILINATDTVFIGIVAIILCFVATIYPARQAAKLEPTEALRYE